MGNTFCCRSKHAVKNSARMEFNQLLRVKKLYKTILKLHRGLPHEIKTIGDVCAREEFKKHKNCKPELESIFVEEWTKYAILLTQQLGVKGPKTGMKLGRNLTRSELDKMSDDQLQSMYEVMVATQGLEDTLENDKENKTEPVS